MVTIDSRGQEIDNGDEYALSDGTPNIIKIKHHEVLKALHGLSVSQARLILDIVIEDFTANAIITSNNSS